MSGPRAAARAVRPRDAVLLALASAGLVASLVLLARVRPNEAPTAELLVPAATLEPLRRVRDLFGPTGEYELVLVSAGAPVSDTRVAQIEAALAGVPGVTRTWSSTSRPHLSLTAADPPAFALVAGPPERGPPQPLDRLLRPSPDAAGIWLALDASTRDLTGARRFEDALHATLDGVRQDGETLVDVGSPARRVASWELAAKDGRRALPWLLAAVVAVPLLFFRSWVAVFFPLLIAGLTSASLLALYQAVYGRLDTWSLVLLPVVWSVATMDALHLYEGSSHGEGGHDAVARTRGEVALPALVTAATTALGLLTLAFPGAPPMLRTFGLWGALGAMLAYAYTFTLGGALLRVFPPRLVPAWAGRATRLSTVAARRRPGRVLVVWALLCAAAAFALPRLRVEANYQHTFAPGIAQGEATARVQRLEDAELVPFEIYLEARTPRARHPGELLLASLALTDYLATLPETRLSLSAATLVSEWVATDPRARAAIGDPRFFDRLREHAGPFASDPRVAEWLRLDRGVARVEVLFRPLSYARKEELVQWIARYVETNTSGYRVTFGGPSFLEHVMEREGLRGIAWGGVTDLVVLVALLAVLLRRPRLVLVALAGNVAPVLVLCGLMAVAGVPWSFDLVGLPILVLGLAIDDTVHLLWPLRGARAGFGTAFQRSIRSYGVAVAATSTLLAASLAGLWLSGFGVSHELGMLLPAGLLLGLAAELSLVPAALAWTRRRGARQ